MERKRVVQDGDEAAGQKHRHDIMVEQGNKELLPAIVLPFCSGLGSVSHRLPVALGPHTHTQTHTSVRLNLRHYPKMTFSYNVYLTFAEKNGG